MNFIQKFLSNFDPRTPMNEFQIVDHGDPSTQVGMPIVVGGMVAKPPPSLMQFAKHNRSWFTAANGEVVDPERNREIMCTVAPESFWREIEADARL